MLDAIDFSAARLRAGRSGRIMFVVKDRDSRAREAVSDAAARKDALAADALSHALFQACARRSGAHIYVVENYRPAPGEKAGLGQEGARKTQHEAAGRDDFYAGVLAWQHRCPVLTADRMRDFADLRHHVAPFIVWEFAPHRARPEKNFVNPAAVAYRAVRAPVRVAFADAGL